MGVFAFAVRKVNLNDSFYMNEQFLLSTSEKTKLQ